MYVDLVLFSCCDCDRDRDGDDAPFCCSGPVRALSHAVVVAVVVAVAVGLNLGYL